MSEYYPPPPPQSLFRTPLPRVSWSGNEMGGIQWMRERVPVILLIRCIDVLQDANKDTLQTILNRATQRRPRDSILPLQSVGYSCFHRMDGSHFGTRLSIPAKTLLVLTSLFCYFTNSTGEQAVRRSEKNRTWSSNLPDQSSDGLTASCFVERPRPNILKYSVREYRQTSWWIKVLVEQMPCFCVIPQRINPAVSRSEVEEMNVRGEWLWCLRETPKGKDESWNSSFVAAVTVHAHWGTGGFVFWASHMCYDKVTNKALKRSRAHRTPTTGGATRMRIRMSRSTEKTGSPDAFEEVLDCKISLQRNSGVGQTDTCRLTEKLVSGTGGVTQCIRRESFDGKNRIPRSLRSVNRTKSGLRRTSLQGNSGVEEPGAVRLIIEKAGRDPNPGRKPALGNPLPPGQIAALGETARGRLTEKSRPDPNPPRGPCPVGTPLGAHATWGHPSGHMPCGDTPRGRLREKPRGEPTGASPVGDLLEGDLQREERPPKRGRKGNQKFQNGV